MRSWVRNSALVVALVAPVLACGIGSIGSQAPVPPVDWKAFNADGGFAGQSAAPAHLALADLEINALTKYVEAMLTRPSEKNAPLAPQLAPLYAPDATLTIPGVYASVTGRDAIAKAYDDLWGPIFPRSAFSASRVFQNSGVLAFTWDLRGGLNEKDGARAFLGVGPMKEPTPVGFAGLTILWFNPDGTIRQDHTYFDVQTVFDQLKDPSNLTQASLNDYEKLVAKMTPLETVNAGLPGHLAEAINTKNEAEFLSFFADNVVHEGVYGVAEGIAAEKENFERITKAFPDFTQKSESFATGDYVVAELTNTGTQLGALRDIPATKKQATWHTASLMLVKDGKIAHEWVFSNRLELRGQLDLEQTETR